MRKFATASLILMGLSGQAQSFQPVSGNQLYEWCQTKENSVGQLACFAYILGVLDTLMSETFIREELCPDFEKVSRRQARDVVVKFLREYPEARRFEANHLVLAALCQ